MTNFRELFMKAPLLITLQRGRDLRLELVNAAAREAIGGRDLTGKTLTEAFPELQGWLHGIAAVLRNGEPYVGVDEPISLDWSGTGTVEMRHLTFVCQPLMGTDGLVDGAAMFAIDVTDRERTRANLPNEIPWLECALDCVRTPVVLAEPGTRRILFSNAAARALSSGWSPAAPRSVTPLASTRATSART